MKKYLLAALLVALQFPIAYAQAPNMSTGNYWVQKCASTIQDEIYQCAIFSAGALGGLESMMSADKQYFCRPSTVTFAQIGAIFGKYLREHPEETHQNAAMLVGFSMIQAFPCPKK